MKIVIPQFGNIHPADSNLADLVRFVGADFELVCLSKVNDHHSEYLAKVFPEDASCLVVNCALLDQWTGGHFSQDLGSFLTSRFAYLFVHALTPGPFCDELVRALSGGRLNAVSLIQNSRDTYQIDTNRDICGPFAGLSFGPVNPANDSLIQVRADAVAVRTLIATANGPLMAALKEKKAEVLLVASRDTIGVHYEVNDKPLSEYFSRFVPHIMALRYVLGEECWHPKEQYASFIVDDPILWPNYGFLNFEALVRLMERNNFSTTVAFIPHNYKRNSTKILEMFQNNPRLAVCFHGNDHTAKELASEDVPHLNTLIGIAESRMTALLERTGLRCNRVMVFPQEYFSAEAMEVLKSHNFYAAVCSTPHPAGQRLAYKLGEFAQPAVLRFGDFPLFLRKYVRDAKPQDIAFDLFFGKPILIVEHHQVFRHPEPLLEAVSMINSLAPTIHWSDLETAATRSVLWRRGKDGTCHIRAYSKTVKITGNETCGERLALEWTHSDQSLPVEQIVEGGKAVPFFRTDESLVRLSTKLAPDCTQEYSILHKNDFKSLNSLGLRWNAMAYLRRRMCDIRDNILTKNQTASEFAETLRKRF